MEESHKNHRRGSYRALQNCKDMDVSWQRGGDLLEGWSRGWHHLSCVCLPAVAVAVYHREGLHLDPAGRSRSDLGPRDYLGVMKRDGCVDGWTSQREAWKVAPEGRQVGRL